MRHITVEAKICENTWPLLLQSHLHTIFDMKVRQIRSIFQWSHFYSPMKLLLPWPWQSCSSSKPGQEPLFELHANQWEMKMFRHHVFLQDSKCYSTYKNEMHRIRFPRIVYTYVEIVCDSTWEVCKEIHSLHQPRSGEQEQATEKSKRFRKDVLFTFDQSFPI